MLIDTFNGALTLNRTLLLDMRESPDVVRRGLMIVLLVGLLVGGVDGVRVMLGAFNSERSLAEFRQGIEDSLDEQALAATQPEQREVINFFRENLEPGIAIAREIMALPTALPKALGAVMQGLATLVSTPLSYLNGLLLAVVLTHIAAIWLGGQGNIQQMVGLGALSVAPHALDALAFIPYIGSAIGLVAWAWGLVVLIIGTTVVHRLDSGRATLAVLLFPVIFGLLAGLACCALFVALVASAGGA